MNRIVWMSDELLATTNPKDWGTLMDQSKKLFDLVGNPDFEHEVVSPQTCIKPLANTLKKERFSVAIDLTGGWLSASLIDILKVPVINQLHLSRVREVSNPALPTSGHVLNCDRGILQQLKEGFDFSKPLILDDVSFSGSSTVLVMKLLGLNPKETTNGFLLTNIGDLGPQPGAKSKIESFNSKLFTGQTLNTSENEDGWHIKDFVQHPFLERSLGLVVTIHEIIQKDGGDSEILRRLFKTQALRDVLFPFALNFQQLNKLFMEGKFIPTKSMDSLREGMHTTNPTLLTSPYFLRHVSAEKFKDNLSEVSLIIRSIQKVSENNEAQSEAIRGLQSEVKNELGGSSPERKL